MYKMYVVCFIQFWCYWYDELGWMFVGVWYDYLYCFVDDVIFDYFVDKGGKNNVVVVRR